MRTERFEVVVELCQYVLLLRLLAAVFVAFNGSLPNQPATKGAIALSCLVAVVATLVWRRS